MPIWRYGLTKLSSRGQNCLLFIYFLFYFIFFFFWFSLTSLSRLFQLIWDGPISRWGENGRTPRKTTRHTRKQNLEEIDRRKLMFFEQLCNLPSHLLVKEFFIHRLMNYFDNPRRQVGFIPDMHRILEKYSLTFALQDFMEHGRFLSKYSWKRLLTERMSSQCRNELLLKANDSASLTRFLKIHDSPEPYMLYHVVRETPKLYKYGKLAVRLLGFLFSGDYTMVCRSCGVVTILNKKRNATIGNREFSSLRVKRW